MGTTSGGLATVVAAAILMTVMGIAAAAVPAGRTTEAGVPAERQCRTVAAAAVPTDRTTADAVTPLHKTTAAVETETLLIRTVTVAIRRSSPAIPGKISLLMGETETTTADATITEKIIDREKPGCPYHGITGFLWVISSFNVNLPLSD